MGIDFFNSFRKLAIQTHTKTGGYLIIPFIGWAIGALVTYLWIRDEMRNFHWEYALEVFSFLFSLLSIIFWPVYWSSEIWKIIAKFRKSSFTSGANQ